jgi:hypothetical protein
MLKKIKKKIRQGYILKSLASNHPNKTFPISGSIKSAGIIVADNKTANFDMSGFFSNAHVQTLFISNKKRPKLNTDQKLYISDLNFWGLPKSNSIQWFVSNPFDILIDLTDINTDFIEYICAKSAAMFKVTKNKNSKAFDLIIQQEKLSDTNFFNEINKAITSFNSKK